MSEVGDVVAQMRHFLEPQWERWKVETGRPTSKETFSSQMCGFTSAFLSCALPELDGRLWCVVGGAPVYGGGGVVGTDGRMHPHFWTVSEDGLLVDLTADQFGLPCLVVSRRGDRRYCESFDSAFVEQHLPRVMPVAEEWLEIAAYEGLLPTANCLAA